jgi:hypothetical protein
MLAALPLIGCATAEGLGSTNRAVSDGVILPNSMCSKNGVAASKDPKGDRMICGFETLVGTHVPKCVCRDEQEALAARESSQEYIRSLEHGRCASNGGGTCN